MKRVILEATDENVLDSISDNKFNRNIDVREFVEVLDTIEGNMFISLDGKWGEGKSFYVRQIEKTLEYLTKKKFMNDVQEIDDLENYFKGTSLYNITLSKSYLPIYYNAWLYDNHEDPLMSLLLILIKKSENFFETKTNSSIKDKLAGVLTSVTLSIGKLPLSIDGEKMKDSFSGIDILEKVKTSEEIRELVKDLLNNVIVERAERLVIIIDELDRCKPSYAIEMLERIKHYFDDERIIFIVSVNKEQLVHTISKYYGNGFDSTGYLNKFFDLSIHLPVIQTYDRNPVTRNNNQHFFNTMVDGLNKYYKLTLRDELIFKQRTLELHTNYIHDCHLEAKIISIFVPIIIILDIKDENEKNKFLKGESKIWEDYALKNKNIKQIISELTMDNSENKFENGLKVIDEIYKFAFKDDERNRKYTNITSDISPNLKRTCLNICNIFKEF